MLYFLKRNLSWV